MGILAGKDIKLGEGIDAKRMRLQVAYTGWEKKGHDNHRRIQALAAQVQNCFILC